MNKLKKEYLFFKQQEPNMRTLLVTNMLYALVLPIVEIFVGAYIMRNTSDPVMVAFLSAGNVYRHHYYLSC